MSLKSNWRWERKEKRMDHKWVFEKVRGKKNWERKNNIEASFFLFFFPPLQVCYFLSSLNSILLQPSNFSCKNKKESFNPHPVDLDDGMKRNGVGHGSTRQTFCSCFRFPCWSKNSVRKKIKENRTCKKRKKRRGVNQIIGALLTWRIWFHLSFPDDSPLIYITLLFFLFQIATMRKKINIFHFKNF